jgi:hypothetical protein
MGGRISQTSRSIKAACLAFRSTECRASDFCGCRRDRGTASVASRCRKQAAWMGEAISREEVPRAVSARSGTRQILSQCAGPAPVPARSHWPFASRNCDSCRSRCLVARGSGVEDCAQYGLVAGERLGFRCQGRSRVRHCRAPAGLGLHGTGCRAENVLTAAKAAANALATSALVGACGKCLPISIAQVPIRGPEAPPTDRRMANAVWYFPVCDQPRWCISSVLR